MQSCRAYLSVVIFGLLVSGVTAFPLLTEVTWLARVTGSPWIESVLEALRYNDQHFPFLAYGTDWLAFAHLVLALMFVGAWRDPVRNVWIIDVGLMACAGVVVVAMVCGPIRHIPWHWRWIDSSFGLFCAVPLWLARRIVHKSTVAPGAPSA